MNKTAPHWNYASVYWLAWFGIMFLGPELYWLFTTPSNTLSYQFWHLEQNRGGITASFARYLTGAGSLWLFFHLTFGWFR